MRGLGKWFAAKGWYLRSGAATGADTAFEEGCVEGQGLKEIFLPWAGFNNRDGPDYINQPDERTYALISKYHPNANKLTRGAKALHARNMHQVLGKDLDTPSNAIICWTPAGNFVGGTTTALRVAVEYGIPIFNFGSYQDSTAKELKKFLLELV